MRRLFLAIGFLSFVLTANASAESLYLTTSSPLRYAYASEDPYVFIAPYFTKVRAALSVSIAKVPASTTATKDIQPSVLRAVWQKTADSGQITYVVSCDLTSLVYPNDTVTFPQAQPKGFSGDKSVLSVSSNTVVVKAESTSPGNYAHGGSMTGAACPPPGDTFSVTFGITPTPVSRGYLYLRRNTFFNDSINVAVGNDGMLSSSDSSSPQQITAILTELAQTAAPFLTGGLLVDQVVPNNTARQKCYSAISSFVKSTPYYNAALAPSGRIDWAIPIENDLLQEDKVALHLKLIPFVPSSGQVNVGKSHPGLVAFFPVPASAQVSCVVTPTAGKRAEVLLSAPTTVNLYTESHFLDPQRDFLTNPQDTFTFNAGFVTGHKYAGTSAARTIVDTLTAPIRALVPSVSVQQNTSVVTGGGKPDQTTTSTQTTTGPPKGQ
jgi:hypothetical protein